MLRARRLVTGRPGEERRQEEGLRERAEGTERDRSAPSEREMEERRAETDRRKEQLQDAWRRRRTEPPAPRRPRRGDKG